MMTGPFFLDFSNLMSRFHPVRLGVAS